jgi:hypothetical protein
MKLTVLVPSDAFKESAGARIRYGRVAGELQRHGVELTLEEVGQFDPLGSDCDAVLISKCHDARSLIVAALAAEQCKLVGVDLFDDYFSDPFDSRLLRYRNWLSQLLPLCDFTLCSTSVMAGVIGDYRPDVPIHQLNDPAARHDTGGLSALIRQKAKLAVDSMCVRVAWFGVGDNPYFEVGLADVGAHAEALTDLQRHGLRVELTILTNKRALSADGLSLLAQLPVASRVEEWTETGERELLRDALVAFLPVNAGAFSVAKSLNRAVTALSSGCQVLSVGYPLYEPMGELIYRRASELLADLLAGSLRFSAPAMVEYRRLLDRLASAETEARRLAAFLAELKPKAGTRRQPLRLVHGQTTRIEAHGMIRAVKGLSVASPYCSAVLDFDVLFRGAFPGLEMLVSRKTASRLLQGKLRQSNGSGDYLLVPDERGGGENRQAVRDWRLDPVPFQLATYGNAMAEIQRRLAATFGPGRTIFSELSPFPFALASAVPE